GPARGAAWMRGARSIANRVTLPLARRAVAAAIVVQVVARTATPIAAHASAPTAVIVSAPTSDQTGAHFGLVEPLEFGKLHSRGLTPLAQESTPTMTYTVQRGDTLWNIAERYYGSGEEFDRLIEANDGKVMPGGRVFDRAGLIFPGWVLDVPEPASAIVEEDGHAYYVVHRGDTLSGIAAELLGDETRYPELFDLNVGVARLDDRGPVFADANLIGPGLRLQLPAEVLANTRPAQESDGLSEPRGEVAVNVDATPPPAITDSARPEPVPLAIPEPIDTP